MFPDDNHRHRSLSAGLHLCAQACRQAARHHHHTWPQGTGARSYLLKDTRRRQIPICDNALTVGSPSIIQKRRSSIEAWPAVKMGCFATGFAIERDSRRRRRVCERQAASHAGDWLDELIDGVHFDFGRHARTIGVDLMMSGSTNATKSFAERTEIGKTLNVINQATTRHHLAHSANRRTMPANATPRAQAAAGCRRR